MAQMALAKNCDNCGTLTACPGNYADPFLSGQCSYCHNSVIIPNPGAPSTASTAQQSFSVSIPQADGSFGTITATGYGLTLAMENVLTGAADGGAVAEEVAPAVEEAPALAEVLPYAEGDEDEDDALS